MFELADESLDDPPTVLAQALQQAGEVDAPFAAWRIGESRSLMNID
ncbi:beta-lactamase fold family Zn-dependent hydrolase [Plautia stali symbiont]|nr:beta-lactamase fold family Zn-dependent hydrolase [Plautia stali symbiont]